jgi:hypothetical protein
MFRPTRRISSNVLFAKTAISFRTLSFNCTWNGKLISEQSFSACSFWTAPFTNKQRKQWLLRSGNMPIEVNNFDKSKRSLRSALSERYRLTGPWLVRNEPLPDLNWRLEAGTVNSNQILDQASNSLIADGFLKQIVTIIVCSLPCYNHT